ncbi:hypothetical protein FRC12_020775 [Ceratobasidium sp. 428]|nr:hypothetical protein FRC12_020775 [Ceratobasidium sp. 428]
MKTIADLNRPILKTWYCASILRAICKDRLASHYGQNDAREVRRRERVEDVELSLPFGSVWDKFAWHTIALVSLGAPLGYLKRIHNVDRTQIGDGVNTLRWRAFLKSLCKEWTDSNLLATVLVSATVALLAIPEINGMARIAGLLSALYALSSVLCGMLLISNHQDRVESFGSTGVVYFAQAKARSTGTTRPLALILSLPLAFMLWGMFWFVLAVMSCAYGPSPEDQLPHRYIAAARYICFIFFSVLAIAGGLVLRFFHGIWNSPTPVKRPTHAEPTAAEMVAEQGGNPLMLFSGDQHLDPPTPGVGYVPDPYKSSFANPLQAGRLSPFSPDGGVPASRPTVSMPVTNFARPSATDSIVNVARPPTLPTTNIARPPTYNSQLRPTGPVAITNQPFSHAASPMAAVVSSRPAERSESLPGYSSK